MNKPSMPALFPGSGAEEPGQGRAVCMREGRELAPKEQGREARKHSSGGMTLPDS